MCDKILAVSVHNIQQSCDDTIEVCGARSHFHACPCESQFLHVNSAVTRAGFAVGDRTAHYRDNEAVSDSLQKATGLYPCRGP